jgi:Tol biopolymer transport system component
VLSESIQFKDRVTGKSVTQLTNGDLRSVHSYYDIPPWSKKDQRIAYTRQEAGAHEGEIWVMDVDGDNPRKLADTQSVSANDGAHAQWTPDGTRVCYQDKDDGQSAIAWINPDTGESGRHKGDLRMVSPAGNYNSFHTSVGSMPDHEVIEKRAESGVFAQNIDDGTFVRLATVEDCRMIHPRKDEIEGWHLYIKHAKWSPDGSRMMFVFTNEIRYSNKYCELPRVKDIYVVNADGTGLKRVGEFGNHPLWHPNGEEILTNSPFEDRPGNSLVLIDVETSSLRLATDKIGGFGHPSFSPDGSRIVVDYVLSGEGYGSLNLVEVESGHVEHLVQMRVHDHSHVGTHLHPVWRQDGKQIMYASDASGRAQLCVIDIED